MIKRTLYASSFSWKLLTLVRCHAWCLYFDSVMHFVLVVGLFIWWFSLLDKAHCEKIFFKMQCALYIWSLKNWILFLLGLPFFKVVLSVQIPSGNWNYCCFSCCYLVISCHLIVLLHILEDIHWIFFSSNVRDLANQWHHSGFSFIICEEILHWMVSHIDNSQVSKICTAKF